MPFLHGPRGIIARKRRASSVSTFSVLDLAPKLWLKADAGVTESGGVVSAWADQSGNGKNASQGTAGLRPSYVTGVQNALPAIRFSGSDRLDVATFGIKSYMWAMVVSNCSHNPGDFFMEHGPNVGSSDGFYVYGYGFYALYVKRAASTKMRATPDGFMSGSANYTIFTYAGAGINAYKNGSAVSETSDDGADTGDTTATDTLYIGDRAGGSLATNGDVFEIILGEGTLSAGNRASLESYAAAKWGI